MFATRVLLNTALLFCHGRRDVFNYFLPSKLYESIDLFISCSMYPNKDMKLIILDLRMYSKRWIILFCAIVLVKRPEIFILKPTYASKGLYYYYLYHVRRTTVRIYFIFAILFIRKKRIILFQPSYPSLWRKK